MMNQDSYIRRVARQLLVLIALIGLTFAAGIEWAEAATPGSDTDAPAAVHVLFLFAATIAFVVHALSRPQRRVPARARERRRIR
jgi:predicted RND superfamily exporter protein